MALLFILAAIAALGAAAYAGARHQAPSDALQRLPADAAPELRGAAQFVAGDFGGLSMTALESNAVPWKLAAAALVRDEMARDPTADAGPATLRRVLQRFGFLFPQRLDGMPPGIAVPQGPTPLGMTHGTIAPFGGAVVDVANLGCAACHAGVAYDARGNPDPSAAVPGRPNTSIDLESYTQAIFAAMRAQAGDGPALVATAKQLFPGMGWREEASLRWLVLPLARQRLSDLAGSDRALPFPNGLPGATNGVAALKYQLRTPLLAGGPGDAGFVSVPDLALRGGRRNLLVDGAYAPARGQPANAATLGAIATFFTVPSMGVHPDEAERHLGEARDVFAWLARYRPPRFPGPVDAALAERGRAVFGRACASCHGSYESGGGEQPRLTAYPDWIGDVGTDPLRAAAFDRALGGAVAGGSYARFLTVSPGRGYVAPPLAGLWASAPYLHNGSVQSLAALLDPAQRLPRFMVGGHALDLGTLGIRVTPDGGYPAGYRPWSVPQWVDTTRPGLGNGGHEYGRELGASERRALLEFLKLL